MGPVRGVAHRVRCDKLIDRNKVRKTSLVYDAVDSDNDNVGRLRIRMFWSRDDEARQTSLKSTYG